MHCGRHGWAVDEVAAAIAIGLLRKMLGGILLISRKRLGLSGGLSRHVAAVVFLHQLLLLLWRQVASLCCGAVERLLLLLLHRLLHNQLLRLLGSHAGGQLYRSAAVHWGLLLPLLSLHGLQSALLKQILLLLLLLLRSQVLAGHLRRSLYAHHWRALHIWHAGRHRHARLKRYVAVGRDLVDEWRCF